MRPLFLFERLNSFFGLGVVGYTLAEILIVLTLSVLLATLTMSILLQRPMGKWGRVTEDYLHNVASTYRQVVLKTGSPPVNTDTSCIGNNVTTCLPNILKSTETAVNYAAGPPKTLTYPGGVTVYLEPEDTNISGDRGNNPTILSSTNNRDWLLLDMNGNNSPNSLSSTGDRVLIYLENTTGRVLTAYQLCTERSVSTYAQSFYDIYKGF